MAQAEQPHEQELLPCFFARMRVMTTAATMAAATATMTMLPQF
jgi:hypothetical protein